MFYDLPLGSNGEFLVGKEPEVEILDLITELYNLNDELYAEEEQKTLDYVSFYSLDNRMRDFLKISHASECRNYGKYLYFKYLPAVFMTIFKKKLLRITRAIRLFNS